MPSPIFVVDSSPAVRRLVEQISTPEGFEVVGFQDGPAALEAARQANPRLIIADYNLDNMTFSGFCKEIHKLDHLMNTYLISLVNSADHPDEEHLRSLGVKAFLKKPFQPDDLLGIIKSVPQKPPQTTTASSGTGLKRRSWPPSADDDDSGSPPPTPTGLDRPQMKPAEPPKISITPISIPIPTSAPISIPMAGQSTAGLQDAMKGLLDHMLLSVIKEAEKKLTDALPRAIEEKLVTHVRPFIQKDIKSQLGEILSAEQLAAIIQPLLSRELPSLLGKELAKCEPLIRQVTSDAVKALATEQLDRWLREQADTLIQKHMSDLIREHSATLDQLMKDGVRTAVAKQASLLTDDVVRSAAEQSIQQSVQRIVPELAEQRIQAELKRLTTSG